MTVIVDCKTCFSAKPAGDIILGSFIAGIKEYGFRDIVFDQFPEIEECRKIADPSCLLKIVGDNDNGILLFKIMD